jgi:hypothetical protein
LLEWEAFDRIQPIGESQMDQRFKTLGAWLCTMLGTKAYQPEDIKGISPELPPDTSAIEEESLEDDPEDYEPREGATSADVLRDFREQSFFL